MSWDTWETNRCKQCDRPSTTVYCSKCASELRGDLTHHPDCPKYVDRDAGCRCREIMMDSYA